MKEPSTPRPRRAPKPKATGNASERVAASKAEKVARIMISFELAMTDIMRDAIEQAIANATFSRETFNSFLREEFKVESLDEVKREQFKDVCKLIVRLDTACPAIPACNRKPEDTTNLRSWRKR